MSKSEQALQEARRAMDALVELGATFKIMCGDVWVTIPSPTDHKTGRTLMVTSYLGKWPTK